MRVIKRGNLLSIIGMRKEQTDLVIGGLKKLLDEYPSADPKDLVSDDDKKQVNDLSALIEVLS